MTPFDISVLAFFAVFFVLGTDREYHQHWLYRLATVVLLANVLIPHPTGQPNGLHTLVSAVAFALFIAAGFVTGGIRISFSRTRKAR